MDRVTEHHDLMAMRRRALEYEAAKASHATLARAQAKDARDAMVGTMLQALYLFWEAYPAVSQRVDASQRAGLAATFVDQILAVAR